MEELGKKAIKKLDPKFPTYSIARKVGDLKLALLDDLPTEVGAYLGNLAY